MAYQQPPALPTDIVWKQNTTVKRKIGRDHGRNHLALIDDALVKCRDSLLRFRPVSRTPGVNNRWEPGAEIVVLKKRLLELVQLCTQWMNNRGEQATNDTATTRKPHVKALGELAFKWLQYVSFEYAKQDKKVYADRMGGAWNKPGTVSLQGTYQHERSAYTAAGKTTTPSATALHQRHDEFHSAPQRLAQAQQLPPEIRAGAVTDAQAVVDTANNAPQAVQTAIGKNFAQLTYQDFTTLNQWLGTQNLSENVWFMNKTERMEHMLVIENGRFYSGFNTPLDMSKYYMYAVNEYGAVFCTKPSIQDPNGATRFNHSSLNAGKDVMCAGELTTIDGHPAINNASGHYQPNRNQMHTTLLMLEATGLDIDNWYVGVVDPGGGCLYYTTALFKADVNVAANRAVTRA